VITPRTLKLVAIGYCVKTLLFGIAWLMVPDLPQRAMTKLRAAWTYVSSSSSAP
jgi:hypothetical protein